ncbi:MAG TPA: hypothetical protein DCS93_42075 [Microscillaceae bacterium]|nr:hypothetical protein [Microscillaceae bacterium]
MKKYHPFIVIGAIGFTISLILHLSFITLEINTSSYWANYMVWVVFLTLGIAKNRSFQEQKASGHSKS